MSSFNVDKKKIAKNTVALYVRMAFTMVVSFIAARVTLIQLGVEDYGLNNLVGSITSMLSFLQVSMGTAVQRFYSIEIGKNSGGRLKEIFRTGLSIHIIIAVIAIILAEIFAVFFLCKMNIPQERMHAANVVFQISIISMALNVVSIPYAAFLRAKEYFDKIAILDVGQAIMRLGIIYLLTVVDFDKLVTLSALNLGVSVIYIFILVLLALQFKDVRTYPYIYKDILKEMLLFVSMLTISTLASMGKTQGLVFLINVFFGLAINAAYAIAVQVSNMLDSFVTNFKQSMTPQLMSAFGSGDTTTMLRVIDLGTKITSVMMLIISFPIIFESQSILNLWLKTPPLYAAELVSLVLININISSLTYFHYQGIQATGKITKNQVVLTLLYLLAVVLFYISFKLGANFYWAMYVNIFISCLVVANGLYFAKKLYAYDICSFLTKIVARLLLVVVFSLVFVLPIVVFLPQTFMRVMLTFGMSAVSVIIAAFMFLFTKDEKNSILNFVTSMLKRKNVRHQI